MTVWDSLLQGLPWIAAITAAGALVTSGAMLLVRHVAVMRERDTLKKADTAAAIASAELTTLGYHLFERLGSASVRSYLTDDEVRSDVTQALAAVRAYLGNPPPASEPNEKLPEPPPSTSASADPELLKAAMSEGTWTQLAKARRDLEIALASDLASGVSERRLSVGQLLALARDQGKVSAEQGAALRWAVDVANRAIHGIEVDPSAALESLVMISGFLDRTRRQPNPEPSKATTPKASKVMHVVPGQNGWEVRTSRAGRAAAASTTQREAVDRARDIIYKSGGGEVVIHGGDGRIRAKDTVASRPETGPSN